MACECGAFKVHKAVHSAREHSDWCPWSPCYAEWLARKGPDITCTNSWALDGDSYNRSFCNKPGVKWVIYSQTMDRKYYFCEDCFSGCFGEGELANILDWGKVQ